MKTKLLALLSVFSMACIPASLRAQDTMLNDFEPGSPEVAGYYGAGYTNVPNPLATGNPTANCGQIKRTTGNWYELVRFATSFSVAANDTRYIHMLVKYSSGVVPNMSVRVDATAADDGSTDIHPINSYTTPGEWQDMVFAIEGGNSGINATQFLFFADPSVNVLNNTDSFAYIDQILLNDSDTPIGYVAEDMVLNDFEEGSPLVTASYGAEYATVNNPLQNAANPSAKVGEIKRTTGNWYELVRFGTFFVIPANATRYIHAKVKYTAASVPNMSVRVDANAGNDGSVDIHPTLDYTSTGQWQDMVFAVEGGDAGITVTQLLFFADASVTVLNNTDSFAYVDNFILNDNELPEDLTAATDIFSKNDITVYPNPANDVWNFTNKNGNLSAIEIADVTGNIVLRKNLGDTATVINASGLAAGIYFAKVAVGNANHYIKLIKK